MGSLSIGTRRQSLTIPISTPRHHHHSTPFQQTHSSPPWQQGLDRSDSGGGFTVALPRHSVDSFWMQTVPGFHAACGGVIVPGLSSPRNSCGR